MTPRKFRQEQEFEFDHFIELTSTGISPDYVNIELFAHEYHRAKLKLLGIADVVVPKGTLPLDKLITRIEEYEKNQQAHPIKRSPERMRTILAATGWCKKFAESLTNK